MASHTDHPDPAHLHPSPGHDGSGAPYSRTGEVAEWTCPMHPEIRRPGPGACPICGMALSR